jgi:hypothetical protein
MTKTSLLFAALLATAAVTAQADELYTPNQVQSTGLTRAQVKQQVLDARRNGELNHTDVDLPAPASNGETFGRTRASVKSETLAARSTGGLDHNDVDLPNMAKGSTLSRQQVRAEAVADRQLVTLTPGKNTIAY